MSHDVTVMLGTILLLWTGAVAAWGIWSLGHVRTRKVERGSKRPW